MSSTSPTSASPRSKSNPSQRTFTSPQISGPVLPINSASEPKVEKDRLQQHYDAQHSTQELQHQEHRKTGIGQEQEHVPSVATSEPSMENRSVEPSESRDGSQSKETGRKKIKIALIPDPRSRQVTFLKRKNGLMKKAMELSVLCNCEVGVIVYNKNNGKMFEYGSQPMEQTLYRYATYSGPFERRKTEKFFDRAGSKNHANIPLHEPHLAQAAVDAGSAATSRPRAQHNFDSTTSGGEVQVGNKRSLPFVQFSPTMRRVRHHQHSLSEVDHGYAHGNIQFAQSSHLHPSSSNIQLPPPNPPQSSLAPPAFPCSEPSVTQQHYLPTIPLPHPTTTPRTAGKQISAFLGLPKTPTVAQHQNQSPFVQELRQQHKYQQQQNQQQYQQQHDQNDWEQHDQHRSKQGHGRVLHETLPPPFPSSQHAHGSLPPASDLASGRPSSKYYSAPTSNYEGPKDYVPQYHSKTLQQNQRPQRQPYQYQQDPPALDHHRQDFQSQRNGEHQNYPEQDQYQYQGHQYQQLHQEYQYQPQQETRNVSMHLTDVMTPTQTQEYHPEVTLPVPRPNSRTLLAKEANGNTSASNTGVGTAKTLEQIPRIPVATLPPLPTVPLTPAIAHREPPVPPRLQIGKGEVAGVQSGAVSTALSTTASIPTPASLSNYLNMDIFTPRDRMLTSNRSNNTSSGTSGVPIFTPRGMGFDTLLSSSSTEGNANGFKTDMRKPFT